MELTSNTAVSATRRRMAIASPSVGQRKNRSHEFCLFTGLFGPAVLEFFSSLSSSACEFFTTEPLFESSSVSCHRHADRNEANLARQPVGGRPSRVRCAPSPARSSASAHPVMLQGCYQIVINGVPRAVAGEAANATTRNGMLQGSGPGVNEGSDGRFDS